MTMDVWCLCFIFSILTYVWYKVLFHTMLLDNNNSNNNSEQARNYKEKRKPEGKKYRTLQTRSRAYNTSNTCISIEVANNISALHIIMMKKYNDNFIIIQSPNSF